METIETFIFWCSKLLWMATATTSSWTLALGRKAVTAVLKIGDISLPTKVYIVKAICLFFFSISYVWMWELDHKRGWALKTDVFELWCCRRLLRVPFTIQRSNQLIRKDINTDYALEGRMLKLKLQHWSSDAKSWFFGKAPDAGKDWRQKEKGVVEDEVAR